MPSITDLLGAVTRGGGALLDRAEQNTMPAPAGGLLSPDDLAAARRQGLLHFGTSLLGDTSGMGLGSAISKGIDAGQNAFAGDEQAITAQHAAARQAGILQARQMIGQKYAPGPNDTPETMQEKYPLMYMDYLKAGDFEGAKELQPIVGDIIKRKLAINDLQTFTTGDKQYTFNKATGQYTEALGPDGKPIEHHENADQVADHILDRKIKLAQLQMAADQHTNDNGQKAQTAFMHENKTLIDSEQLYGSWKAALAQARAGNPTAFGPAIINFAANADPKLQVRQGILNYVSHLDRSFKGNLDMAVQRLSSGTLGTKYLDAMDSLVTDVHKNNVTTFNTRRQGRVNANRGLDLWLPTVEETFPTSLELPAAGSAPANGGSRVDAFLKGNR